MEEKKISLKEWESKYYEPLRAYAEDKAEPTEEMVFGLAGFVLDGILAVQNIEGEEATDWECVHLVSQLIEMAQKCEDIL